MNKKDVEKLKELLTNYEVIGTSIYLEPLEEDEGEKVTDAGIVLVGDAEENIKLKKGRVIKTGKGYISEYGQWVPNLIQDGAEVYYKHAAEYELEGIKFLGTDIGNISVYKNRTKPDGAPWDSGINDFTESFTKGTKE